MEVIIYHNADPDGIFSGAIALKAFPDATTIGYNYEPEMWDIIESSIGKDVVMVDVSPANWKDMHHLCTVATKVTWIDHHQTAYDEMIKHKTQELFKNFEVVFETEKWGACRKVFKYFFPEHLLPDSVEYVAGYDVFRKEDLLDWEYFYLPFRYAVGNIKTPEEVLVNFSLKFNENIQDWLDRGRTIVDYIEQENKNFVQNPKLVHRTLFFDIQGDCKTYKVLAVNRTLFGDIFKSVDTSDIDFVVGFFAQDTVWKVSLRGTGKEINLSKIAKHYGGGGHKDAAGFSIKNFDQLNEIVLIEKEKEINEGN